MTTNSDQPAPPNPLFLRDRLLATVVEFGVKTEDGPLAVESVLRQLTSWMREMASQWQSDNTYDVDMALKRASAELLKSLADGIDAGAPDEVSPQDPRVQ